MFPAARTLEALCHREMPSLSISLCPAWWALNHRTQRVHGRSRAVDWRILCE